VCRFSFFTKLDVNVPFSKMHSPQANAVSLPFAFAFAKGECGVFANSLKRIGKWRMVNGKAFKGRRPPFGGKGGGERKRGEGGRDLPRGALARSASPPLPPPPPLGPRNPTGNPSLCFFSSFSFSTFSAQPVISCAIVVRALSTFCVSLCNVLLLLPLAFLKCSIL
jgi:hypothetical protein